MRFGVFYEHQLPRPWAEDDERQLFQDALEQCEFADQLGFEYVWGVEHHFMEEYSHSSAPEVFLAALSQRTRNIRLGHGIIQTPPTYNHPVRVAERLATLDLVSNGRVEFGSGESSSATEILGFGMDPEEKHAEWREGLEVAIRCMTETPFTGVDGRYVVLPPRNVVPKTVQKPHPPLWLACTRRKSILRAAELGMGALAFAFIEPEDAARWVADYEATLAERCVPIGLSVNPALACTTTVMCHRDEKEALRRGLEGANFFGYSLGHYYVYGEHRPGRTDVWGEFKSHRSVRGHDAAVAAALESETLGAELAAGDTASMRVSIGTPEQLRSFLRRYERAGVDQIIFVQQTGRNRHEHIMESLELLGREVLPEFRERDEKQRSEKAKRLEPAIEAALQRRESRSPAALEEHVVDAFPRQALKAAGREEELREMAESAAVGRDA
jgi:alkanesulfonate monooxygenase SsuD/methylene tetrahydromethanopterin reductase-like flavin-dependent oxidoreductase (luciferase family)